MKKRILLVDHEPQVLTVYGIMTKKFGYEFDIATNGLDALDLFNARGFDGIITDIVMAKMGGLELLRRIREVDQKIPAGIIGGFPLERFKPVEREFLDANIMGYFLKPVGVDDFKNALFHWFGPPDTPSFTPSSSPTSQESRDE